MQKVFGNLGAAFANPHVSISLAIAIALEILPIWFPSIKSQCMETQKILAGYAVIAASNSGPKPPVNGNPIKTP
jgi:hypothetical protein